MQECTGSPVWGLIILVLLIILNGIFYGFAAAIRNISENDVSKKAAEGNKKAGMLLDLIERPQHYLNLMPLIMSSLARIDVIANAMELRGFGKNPKERTWYVQRAFKRNDYIAILFGFMLLLFSVGTVLLNGSRFYNPFM